MWNMTAKRTSEAAKVKPTLYKCPGEWVLAIPKGFSVQIVYSAADDQLGIVMIPVKETGAE